MGRRGPGRGLRQAHALSEAADWRRLFEALASEGAQPLLPHLGLRSTDAAPLRAQCAPVAASLRSILAETPGPRALECVNDVLASAYAAMERAMGARVARAVFAAAADGFPGAEQRRVAAAWSDALARLRNGGFAASGLPGAKRDTITALLANYAGAVEPAVGAPRQEAAVAWLQELVRWRRFASACRALAKVLTPAERQRFAAFAAGRDAAPVPATWAEWVPQEPAGRS